MREINRRGFVKRSATATITLGSMIGPKTWAGANDKIHAPVVGFHRNGQFLLMIEKNTQQIFPPTCDRLHFY